MEAAGNSKYIPQARGQPEGGKQAEGARTASVAGPRRACACAHRSQAETYWSGTPPGALGHRAIAARIGPTRSRGSRTEVVIPGQALPSPRGQRDTSAGRVVVVVPVCKTPTLRGGGAAVLAVAQ